MANEFARALRKRMTPWEARMWVHLRGLRAKGYHFRRQVPLEPYVVDFACLPRRLIVEIDGEAHKQYADADRERDAALQAMGFRVLRFWNADITRDLEGVMETILAVLEGRK